MTLDRRSLLALGGAAAAAGIAGCAQKSTGTTQGGSAAPAASGSGSAGAASGALTVHLSGDTNMQDLWEKALVPAFIKAFPNIKVTVNLDLHGERDAQTQAKLTAASQSGQDAGIDLVDAGFVSTLPAAGIMEVATKATIPNLDGVPEETIKAGKGGIPYRGSSVLLAFDSKKVTKTPTTLDELLAWIKANPGQFTYCPPKSGGSGGAFCTTVLDKFLDPAAATKLRTDLDADAMKGWDKGFAELRGLNPSIYNKGTYPNGNKQALDLLSSGQISMTTAWSDQFITGQKTGLVPAHVKATQISNPSFTGGAAYIGVVKGSKNKELALKLANFVLSPESQALIAQQISGYPVIPLSKLPADLQKIFTEAHPETLRAGYLDKVGKELNARWDQEVPGK